MREPPRTARRKPRPVTALMHPAACATRSLRRLPPAAAVSPSIQLPLRRSQPLPSPIGSLTVPSATTITGATTGSGASLVNLVTVDGGSASTVFIVSSGVTSASIANLTIQHGNGSQAGGISNSGSLTLTSDSIINNTIFGGSTGGGISNSGTLVLNGSTISVIRRQQWRWHLQHRHAHAQKRHNHRQRFGCRRRRHL